MKAQRQFCLILLLCFFSEFKFSTTLAEQNTSIEIRQLPTIPIPYNFFEKLKDRARKKQQTEILSLKQYHQAELQQKDQRINIIENKLLEILQHLEKTKQLNKTLNNLESKKVLHRYNALKDLETHKEGIACTRNDNV